MDVGAAKFLGSDFFTRRRFYERWPAQGNGALIPNDDCFIAHRWNVCTARSAGAKDSRNLINTTAGHACLVVENAAKVVTIRKHIRLKRQKGTSGIDKVETGQAVLHRDFLGA